MKLTSEDSVNAVKELQHNPFFNHLLSLLSSEYEQLCRTLMYAEVDKVEALRGQARTYYEILTEIEKAKQV